jgi:hypothetical protein
VSQAKHSNTGSFSMFGDTSCPSLNEARCIAAIIAKQPELLSARSVAKADDEK